MVEEVDTLQELVAEYEQTREDASLDQVKRNQALTRVAQKLDKIYWDKVSKIIARVVRSGREKLLVGRDDRMLIDTGFLDPRLVGKDANIVKGQLFGELNMTNEEAQPVFYFSDWIGDRLKNYLLVQEMPQEEARQPEEEPERLKELREKRTKVYNSVGVLFQKLPGVPPKLVDLVLSGGLDLNIENVSGQFLRTKEAALQEQGRKLVALKKGVLAKVKARITNPAHLKVVDLIAHFDRDIFRELLAFEKRRQAAEDAPKPKPKSQTVELDERVEYLQGELRLVKQLILLGVMQAGITKTHSVLVGNDGRITKRDVYAALEHIRGCDAGFRGRPNVLIAPYRGTGFFEFDRDTMFVPLIPTRENEEAIIDAVASYRILIDMLHHEGQLKREFERAFPGMNFRTTFIKEYKNWIQKIGRGKRAQQEPAMYDFFKAHVGPNPARVIGPVEVLGLSPDEETARIKISRERIRKEEAEYDDYYALAIIYWKRRNYVDAYQKMHEALQLNPSDGRTLFSVGAILHAMDRMDKAKRAFEECVNTAQNSLWQVYAWEMLEKIR